MGRQPCALGPRRNIGGRRQRFLHLLSRWEKISDSRDNLLKMVGSVRADLSGHRGFSL